MVFYRLRVPMALSMIFILNGCGSATFDGGSTARPSSDAYHGQDVESLMWFWQCDSAPAEAPITNNSKVVITGGGDHRFKSASFDKTPLSFSGKVCPPVTYPRDIIFVIDTSGSMKDNDPKISNSCGRMKSVEAIINDVTRQGGDSRYGIITFASKVVAQSSAMFGDRANLFADIARGGSIANTLCGAFGDTSYGPPLAAAEAILQGSRPGAMKEIYFISDGEPHDSAGPEISKRLQNPGVMIGGKYYPVSVATVMLGSANDTVLRNDIATKSADGQPLHVGSVQASNLAATLSKLAENEVIDGKMKYRATGTDDWQEIALIQNMKDYSFSMPSITLDKSIAPKGLEVVFEYRDRHNNVYSSQGQILWTDLADETK